MKTFVSLVLMQVYKQTDYFKKDLKKTESELQMVKTVKLSDIIKILRPQNLLSLKEMSFFRTGASLIKTRFHS